MLSASSMLASGAVSLLVLGSVGAMGDEIEDKLIYGLDWIKAYTGE